MKRHPQRQGDSAEAKILRKNISARKHERQKPVVIAQPPVFTVASLARFIAKDKDIKNVKGGVRSLGFRWKPVKQALKRIWQDQRHHAKKVEQARAMLVKSGHPHDNVEWTEGRKAFVLSAGQAEPREVYGDFRWSAFAEDKRRATP
jgi:uncharacterized protein (UPF0335 family)